MKLVTKVGTFSPLVSACGIWNDLWTWAWGVLRPIRLPPPSVLGLARILLSFHVATLIVCWNQRPTLSSAFCTGLDLKSCLLSLPAWVPPSTRWTTFLLIPKARCCSTPRNQGALLTWGAYFPDSNPQLTSMGISSTWDITMWTIGPSSGDSSYNLVSSLVAPASVITTLLLTEISFSA